MSHSCRLRGTHAAAVGREEPHGGGRTCRASISLENCASCRRYSDASFCLRITNSSGGGSGGGGAGTSGSCGGGGGGDGGGSGGVSGLSGGGRGGGDDGATGGRGGGDGGDGDGGSGGSGGDGGGGLGGGEGGGGCRNRCANVREGGSRGGCNSALSSSSSSITSAPSSISPVAWCPALPLAISPTAQLRRNADAEFAPRVQATGRGGGFGRGGRRTWRRMPA